jgi:hypothetical protein
MPDAAVAHSMIEVRCPSCGEALDLSQPDRSEAYQLLGVCSSCDAWFRMGFGDDDVVRWMSALPLVIPRAAESFPRIPDGRPGPYLIAGTAAIRTRERPALQKSARPDPPQTGHRRRSCLIERPP